MNIIFKPFINLYNYLLTYNKTQLSNNIIEESIIKNIDIVNNDENIIEITVNNLIDNVIIKVEENQKKNIYIKELLETCNTGDIILFQGKSIISEIIKLSTNSVWTHIGIIIKNPTFIKNCHILCQIFSNS